MIIDTFNEMKSLIRCLNRREVELKDALRAARKTKADVIFSTKIHNDGYYIPSENSLSGKSEIYINANLSERKQAAKIVHELTHLRRHSALNVVLVSRCKENTSIERQQKYWRHKFEYEAELMEAIAMIPRNKLKNATRGLFDPPDVETDGYWFTRLTAKEKHNL